jgi:phosphoribosylformylglycinamidine synthase
MVQIAIITSPGHNTEIETFRELKRAGLDAKIYRWNEDPNEIANAESFIIPGGFSYEDRGRAGLVSAQNPVMQVVYQEAHKGKPVIGICNGAQALVEMKLVPGDINNTKALALAKNKRVKDGEVLGTGYYNVWVWLKRTVEKGRTPFTHFVEDRPYLVPIAHGEGRYSTIYPDLETKLQENEQVVFKYCDQDGNIIDSFPTNPNGAMLNAASICNAEGNVVSIMPHPERGRGPAPLLEMFSSLKHHLEEKPKLFSFDKYELAEPTKDLKNYEASGQEIVIEEIITDNEAYTLENTVQKVMNIKNIKLKRYTHYEIKGELSEEQMNTVHESGELYNSNKQAEVKEEVTNNRIGLLVRYREDFEGQSKVSNLKHHYNLPVKQITKGTLWIFEGVDKAEMKAILETGLFYNINSQVAYEYL